METAATAIYPLELGWYQINHYETWYTPSQDTNEAVDKLGMATNRGYSLELRVNSFPAMVSPQTPIASVIFS
eukprot:scaffold14602_cov52-Cyclotella_meneghiniana.AAC.2